MAISASRFERFKSREVTTSSIVSPAWSPAKRARCGARKKLPKPSGADPHRAGKGLIPAGNILLGVKGEVLDFLRSFNQPFACCRQRITPVAGFEKRRLHRFLQGLDPAPDGDMVDAALRGRQGGNASVGDRRQIAQVVPVE